MKRILAVILVTVGAAACSDSLPVTPVAPSPGTVTSATIVGGDIIVTSSNDDGPGSFRDAIAQANGNVAIQSIGFHPSVHTIHLQSGITYGGTQDLIVNANGSTLDGSATAFGTTAFSATGGGDLTIIGLKVRNAKAQGIQVDVPGAATGIINLVLTNVDIIGSGGHGFLVNDQDNPVVPDTDPPTPPDPAGSAAGLNVTITSSGFLRNGNTPGLSVSDNDGVRINEGGDGDLSFTFHSSRANENGADGVELDERGNGDVILDVANATFNGNGPFDTSDLDDGFDIDEANDGSIRGTVRSSVASHNFEEGLDFNENDNGDLRVDLVDVEASWNREEGIDYEEDDDFPASNIGATGHLVATMTRVKAIGNGVDGGDGGLKIREKQGGNLTVTLTDIIANGNFTSGIFVRESSGGGAAATITGAVASGNRATSGNGDGIELEGSFTTPLITNTTVSANDGFGVRADAGTVTLSGVKGGGNDSGPSGGGATFVIVP